jgi:uncharacterized protein YeaO (DUF488 family)
MTIYTSYFAKAKLFPSHLFIKTAVCYKTPFSIGIWNSVVPSAELVFGMKRGEITKEYYEECYYQMLLDRKDQIAQNIPYLKNGERDVVLLCYEKPTDWCHRHILARFLNEHFDLDIQEYKFD